jgi:hemoglobin-like flavoprotein
MKKRFTFPKLMKVRKSSTVEQFWLALIATTVSIILTFGTNAIIEYRQKKKDKREMVLMIMYDFDKTIERVQHADTLLQRASHAQKEVALHPESYNSYQPCFLLAIGIVDSRFAETTEKIFSSNIETFNTLGNVNFVHEVSAFYNARHYYQESVIDALEADVAGSGVLGSLEGLFSVDFPTYYVSNKQSLVQLKSIRNRCMKMMKVGEEELREFGEQRVVEDVVSEEDERIHEQAIQEYLETEKVIREAKEKFLKEEQ